MEHSAGPPRKIALAHLSFTFSLVRGTGPRLVFHLSRRFFNAVQRNRIKRKIRERFRLAPETVSFFIRVHALKKFNPFRAAPVDDEVSIFLGQLPPPGRGARP